MNERWTIYLDLPSSKKKQLRKKLSPLGQAACEYAERGWAVCPAFPLKKVPHIEGGFNNAIADVDHCIFWWTLHPDDNILIATGDVSGGLCVIDIDAKEWEGKYGDEVLFEYELEHGKLPETVCATTASGGVHLFYRRAKACGDSRNNSVLNIDRRENGGCVVAAPSVVSYKKYDEWVQGVYEWDLDPDDYDVANVDDSVHSFITWCDSFDCEDPKSQGKGSKAKFVMPDKVVDGQGRHAMLVKQAFSYRSQGMEFEEILERLRHDNQEHIEPPKPDSEVAKIARSVCKKPSGLSPEAQALIDAAKAREESIIQSSGFKITMSALERERFTKNGKPDGPLCANSVGADMKERYHACKIDGAPFIWNGERYVSGVENWERAVCMYKTEASSRERSEVVKWLHMFAEEHEMSSGNLIAFKNGVLDVTDSTMTLQPNTPDLYIPNVIPHNFNPDAYDDNVHKMLIAISCGDADVLQNLLEIIGLGMYHGREFGALFLLINNTGSNGKSTFIHFIEHVIGAENISNVDMNTVGKRFQSVPLIGKLMNIGDDQPADYLEQDSLGIVKKIVTGDIVPYEYKGGKSGQFRPYCTCVYAMNRFPKFADVTGGMTRRLHPVPMRARFDLQQDGFDPHIEQKLRTEQAAEYAIAQGINTLINVLDNMHVTETEFSREQIQDIRETGSAVVQFLAEMDYTSDSIVGNSTNFVFNQFEDWRRYNRPDDKTVRKTFTKRVQEELGVSVEKKQKDNVREYAFVESVR